MVKQIEFSLPAYPRGVHLITDQIVRRLTGLPETGILHLFIKHTSAAITINENSAPEVLEDIDNYLNDIVPEGKDIYKHYEEGKDDMPGHIKALLTGSSLFVPITDGQLNFGTWQGIYLCEFRNNGGQRKLVASIIS
jgi:secondary thiamine-phosphate synthase enzyme